MRPRPIAPPWTPGTRVGAERWPFQGAHPDCWGAPWTGTVLAIDDPRAWAGTLAFPGPEPDADAVRAHIERHRQDWPDAFRLHTPVLWHFGPGQERVWWERTEALLTVEEDTNRWARALRRARAEMTRDHIPRPATA